MGGSVNIAVSVPGKQGTGCPPGRMVDRGRERLLLMQGARALTAGSVILPLLHRLPCPEGFLSKSICIDAFSTAEMNLPVCLYFRINRI